MTSSIATVGAAVAGVVLAVVTALGVPALVDSGAKTSNQPAVSYGTR